jgi:hypothetical protein
MAGPKEIPQLATELVDLSKQYLRQEVLEPLKKVGAHLGFGLGAGLLFAFAALFIALGAYQLYLAVLPEGEWWVVLARGLTLLTTAAGAGLIGWRMSRA